MARKDMLKSGYYLAIILSILSLSRAMISDSKVEPSSNFAIPSNQPPEISCIWQCVVFPGAQSCIWQCLVAPSAVKKTTSIITTSTTALVSTITVTTTVESNPESSPTEAAHSETVTSTIYLHMTSSHATNPSSHTYPSFHPTISSHLSDSQHYSESSASNQDTSSLGAAEHNTNIYTTLEFTKMSTEVEHAKTLTISDPTTKIEYISTVTGSDPLVKTGYISTDILSHPKAKVVYASTETGSMDLTRTEYGTIMSSTALDTKLIYENSQTLDDTKLAHAKAQTVDETKLDFANIETFNPPSNFKSISSEVNTQLDTLSTNQNSKSPIETSQIPAISSSQTSSKESHMNKRSATLEDDVTKFTTSTIVETRYITISRENEIYNDLAQDLTNSQIFVLGKPHFSSSSSLQAEHTSPGIIPARPLMTTGSFAKSITIKPKQNDSIKVQIPSKKSKPRRALWLWRR